MRHLTTKSTSTVGTTALAEAFAFVDAVVAQPHHLSVASGPRHLALVRPLCQQADATGDLVPDAVLGAVAEEHGAIVATLDRDFARFGSVRHLRRRSRALYSRTGPPYWATLAIKQACGVHRLEREAWRS